MPQMRQVLPHLCDCGASGYVILEEDDVRERMEGGANPKIVAIRGQFLLKDGIISCSECGKSDAKRPLRREAN